MDNMWCYVFALVCMRDRQTWIEVACFRFYFTPSRLSVYSVHCTRKCGEINIMEKQTQASEENKTTTQLQQFISLPGEIKTSWRKMLLGNVRNIMNLTVYGAIIGLYCFSTVISWTWRLKGSQYHWSFDFSVFPRNERVYFWYHKIPAHFTPPHN